MNRTTPERKRAAALSVGTLYLATGAIALLLGPIKTPPVVIAATMMAICGLILLTQSARSRPS